MTLKCSYPLAPKSHNLTILQSYNLTISQSHTPPSHNLTIPQSHNFQLTPLRETGKIWYYAIIPCWARSRTIRSPAGKNEAKSVKTMQKRKTTASAALVPLGCARMCASPCFVSRGRLRSPGAGTLRLAGRRAA